MLAPSLIKRIGAILVGAKVPLHTLFPWRFRKNKLYSIAVAAAFSK
jgi:phosphotransacetylase